MNLQQLVQIMEQDFAQLNGLNDHLQEIRLTKKNNLLAIKQLLQQEQKEEAMRIATEAKGNTSQGNS